MKVKDIPNADLIIALIDDEFRILDRSYRMLEDYTVKEVFTNCCGELVVRIQDMKSEVENA